MEYIGHDSRMTAYTVHDGKSPTILFVHGSGSSHSAWSDLFERLPYRLVGIDLSGHGYSEDVETDPGPEALQVYGEDVVAVANATDTDVLAGHSLGGAVVQHVTVDTSFSPSALLLIGTGAKLAVREDIREELEAEIATAPPQSEWDPSVSDADAHPVVRHRDFLTCHTFDNRARLDEITVPAIAITGENDEMTFPWYHEYLADNLPDCKLSIIPNAAHSAYQDRPDEFATEVISFIDQLS